MTIKEDSGKNQKENFNHFFREIIKDQKVKEKKRKLQRKTKNFWTSVCCFSVNECQWNKKKKNRGLPHLSHSKLRKKTFHFENVDQKNSNQSIELNWIWLDSIQIDDRWWWWWEHFLVIKSELNLTELNFKWLTDWQPIINSLSLSLWNWRTLFHCQMTYTGWNNFEVKKKLTVNQKCPTGN